MLLTLEWLVLKLGLHNESGGLVYVLEDGITCYLLLDISFLDFLISLHHLDDILVSGNTGHVCSIPQYLCHCPSTGRDCYCLNECVAYTFFLISSLDVLTWYLVLNIFSWCLDIPPQTSWCLGVWLVAAKYDPHSSIPVFKLWGPCGIILCS